MTGELPQFRAGDRVVLLGVPDGYPDAFNIRPGMTGTVNIIDSQHTVHVRWDCGSRFGIIAAALHLLRHESGEAG